MANNRKDNRKVLIIEFIVGLILVNTATYFSDKGYQSWIIFFISLTGNIAIILSVLDFFTTKNKIKE
jgi:hypothetical protein